LHAGTALSLAAAAANFLFEVPLVSKHPVVSATQWCCQVLKYEQVGADLTVRQRFSWRIWRGFGIDTTTAPQAISHSA